MLSLRRELNRSLDKLFLTLESHEFQDLSLLDGSAGMLLFFHEYYKYTDKDPILFLNEINKFYSDLSNEKLLDFANGLTGQMLVLNYLSKENRIGLEESFFDQVDKVLFKKAQLMTSYDEFDYFYGATGIGIYFVERNLSEEVSFLIDELERSAIKDEKGYRWLSQIEDEDGITKNIYQISLSHGSSAILTFLVRCIKFGGKIESKAKYLIEKTVDYIQYCRIDDGESIYPDYGKVEFGNSLEPNYSRLAWCNGDLGILFALYKVAISMEDINLEKSVIKSLIETTKRTTVENTGTIDSGFCHGYGGIALIYKKLYRSTGIDEFEKASVFWIEKVLVEIKSSENPHEIVSIYLGNDKFGMDYSLINGALGISLIILDFLHEGKSNWSHLLLL